MLENFGNKKTKLMELNSAEFEAQGTISRRANALGEMAAARFSQLSLNELIKM